MNKVLIIADDLTGANANCALMKEIGLRAASILGDDEKLIPENIDVIALTTDSRAMDRKLAEKLVYEKVKKFSHDGIFLYSKRIDSTLRGNLGSELWGYQRAFSKKKLAICVPAFPNSGRIVIDDKMYVNGIPLIETDAGKDSKIPVVSNLVSENFKKDYPGKISRVEISDINDKDSLIKTIRNAYNDADLLIFDAITNEQIRNIAEATIASGVDFISVDPGPFTKDLTDMFFKKSEISTKALALVGSVTEITIRQLKYLRDNYDCYQINVNPLNLLDLQKVNNEIDKAVEEGLKNIDDHTIILVTTSPEKFEDRLDLNEVAKEKNLSVDDASLMISRGLAKILKEILIAEKSISGIFTSGGDITVAATEELMANGIEIKNEIAPLIAYGRVIGGLKPGLKIISKGGMVGNDTTIAMCMDNLLK